MRSGSRRNIVAVLAVFLVFGSTACSSIREQIAEQTGPSPSPAASAAAPTPSPQTDSGDGRDLFEEDEPEMVSVKSDAKTNGEFFVPKFCRPQAAGLKRAGDGFLLVVRTEDEVPPTDAPPPLPFGIVLLHHEVSLGMFDPREGADLGAQYVHTRQYQTPDRPTDRLVRLGEGDEETVQEVDIDVQDDELRLAVPDVGDDAAAIAQWGLRFSCVLRHPVDGIYFPTTRVPADQFERIALDRPNRTAAPRATEPAN